ncbi:cuticle protein AMP1A-like isoform X3 [Panulirus ornatus]|uniref:cuticle protein AMP1A-like isoform X3 n=1 Tax=Panulirus ornatus TaxID=150431 RepID=UPI003A885213
MKFVVLACVVTLALAAPRPDETAETLVDERSDSGDGNFNYIFETSNGIYEERVGTPGEKGQSNMAGIIRFTLADGSISEYSYVADENGYRVEPLIVFDPPEPVSVGFAAASEGVIFE